MSETQQSSDEAVVPSWEQSPPSEFKEYREQRQVSTVDLARELNRLHYDIGFIPTRSDVKKHGRYSLPTYEKRFGSLTTALRAANVTPQIDHVCNAVQEYYESGLSYCTTRQILRYMYPRCNSSTRSRDFGTNPNEIRANEQQWIDEHWKYPRMSPQRIAQVLSEIADGIDGYPLTLELWSDSQRRTWRIVHDE